MNEKLSTIKVFSEEMARALLERNFRMNSNEYFYIVKALYNNDQISLVESALGFSESEEEDTNDSTPLYVMDRKIYVKLFEYCNELGVLDDEFIVELKLRGYI